MRAAVEHLARRVGVTGVPRGLLDEVQHCPPKVERLVEPEQHVRGRTAPFAAEARCLEGVGREHDLLGAGGACGVRVDRTGQGQFVADAELLLARRELVAEVAAVDPAPLDVREMVDDPDDRQEAPVGRPPRLLVGEPAGRSDDRFALAV